ncbi:gamma-tubulin complex component 3 homolog [Maniola jurtina]|uniref:gamma-tubulin complex component 3 homolog n=1 Tax=Maniola jurtina TaxID=191418 RepID=UPI001E68D895|nr:gamma-tubulin complex component 3 homolog [Maniola jurtina]XP_045760570.1 gamma-tubulin complex component 3 homolog [Maniola jurtina]
MEHPASSVASLLRKLCEGLSPDPDGAYELALSYLATNEKVRSVKDERQLCQKINARMSARDSDKFNESYAKLKNSFVLKQRVAVLSLLLALSETPQSSESTMQLFPMPDLAVPIPAVGSTAAASSSSKSTIGSASWSSHAPKQQGSNQSLPSIPNNNSGIPFPSNDRWSERSCVRDAVLAATGVKARGSSTWPRPVQVLYSRITHLGFLHDRLKEFIDPSSELMPQGLMGEGLVTSIRDELTEYYRSIAILQSQVCEGDGGGGTLRRVCVWAQEPLHRLTWLANIAHTAHHKKGGELASCVHCFVRHGDERVATLARRLLTALTYPLLLMLTRWLLHGEIDDPFNEFFIESRSGVPIDRMWHDKYRVREWMVPSFMSREQAAQILATGKSVVFMREACADEPMPADHHHHLHDLLKSHAASVTSLGRPAEAADASDGAATAWWEAHGLRAGVGAAHAAASARLLAALTTHHHLLDHLAAHRRYLLLAQGDFVHHLMTLLQEELNKPATSLYVHNLTCTLETAVRATNAQFEPPHVLARLHVNLYPNCDGREDSGWDVFALQYRVDGPLGTLFPATCAARYRALFTQLWRVKRIEHALHHAWRDHTILQKRLRTMPEVWGLMRRVSCLRAEALRLCGALQEASFEGAEAAWAELLAAAAARQHLDRLLALHHRALDRHSIHAMIHHTTQELQSYLGNVLNETLSLRSFETTLHAGINRELERRDQLEQLKAERVSRGEFPVGSADEARDKEKRKIFQQFLANRKADLNVWARTYRGHVTTLILKLALHAEVSLQTLAFRLDYSDFYKRGDAKLHEPLTYQHKRLSEIGLHLAKSKLMDNSRKK